MLPSTRVSVFVMFWLLTEGWCSQPTHSSAGNTLMSRHGGMTTHSVPTPLPLHLSQLPDSQEDAAGAHSALNHFVVVGGSDVGDDHTVIFVKDFEIKSPITQEEPSRYDHDADETLTNNTQLNVPIMGVSEDSVMRAVATTHNTVDDIMMKTSVLNVSSDPHQNHTQINRTFGNIHPIENMTLAGHAQDDKELLNNDHMVRNTNILRHNSALVRSQKPVRSIPAESSNNEKVKRYRHIPLHDDAPLYKESFLLQTDSQKTVLESNSGKQENSTNVEDISKVTPVRKCFGIDEFYNFATQRSEALEDNTAFTILVRKMLEKTVNTDLRIVPLKMEPCQGPGDNITREPIDFTSHSVLPFGYLRDLKSKINYDQDHYCLEMEPAGTKNNSSDFYLVKIFCPLRPIEVSTRKCCGLNEYFNLTDRHCHPRSSNVSDNNDLVQEFSRNIPGVTSIQWNTSKLICRHGEPRRVSTDQAFLDSSNQLCERQSGQCYPNSLYCIEYSWAEGTPAMVAEASICPVDSFYKCCPRGHILTKSGCISASREDVSPYMLQLLEEMEPKFGIPARTNDCQCVEKLFNESDSNIHWWKSKPQYPPVDIQAKNLSAIRYCVDDYRGPDNHTVTVAIVCYTEVGNVRKCCPWGQYMEIDTCVTDILGHSLLHDPLLSAANLTKLTDNYYPTCENNKGYHVYYMGRRSSEEDYGEMVDNQELQLVNMDAGCRLNDYTIKRENYCLEYFGNATVQHLKVMMCLRSSKDLDENNKNFWAKAVLLSLSCVALLATTLYILPQKVNKGYSVRKVKTLAGRLQLSYVLTSLVGFLLLAVNMVVPFYQDSLACYIMSGLLTFFLLAGFQWNTSICIEALLITLSFRMFDEDEGWRYILHSLWAWGVPGLITSLALTLNHYRASLPCSVITPRIGLTNCFFSDQKAKLVYLYMPMLLTLCANTFLLVASRCVRSANLRRLEKGSVESMTAEDGHTVVTSRHSGLRSHRTQNLLTEGVIMVMWSGAMWFMEVIAFLVAFNSDEPSHDWYNYLWYIPSSLNCLRGIGIFLIVVLTPENRSKLARTCNRVIRSMTACNYKARSSNLTARSRSSDVQAVGIRRFNMSIHEGIDLNTDVTSDETLSSSLADSELGSGIGEADVSAKRHKKSQ